MEEETKMRKCNGGGCLENAVYYCQECNEFYCEECFEFKHNKIKKYRNEVHNPTKDFNDIVSDICPLHPGNKLELFSDKELRPLCTKCYYYLNNGKKYAIKISSIEDNSFIKEYYNKYSEQISNIIKINKDYINNIKEDVDKLSKEKNELIDRLIGNKEKNIIGIFEKIRNNIDQRESEIIREIDLLFNMNSISDTLRNLENDIEKQIKTYNNNIIKDNIKLIDSLKIAKFINDENRIIENMGKLIMNIKTIENNKDLFKPLLSEEIFDDLINNIKSFGIIDKNKINDNNRINNNELISIKDINNKEIILKWVQHGYLNLHNIQYKVILDNLSLNEEKVVYEGSNNTCNINNLIPNINYNIRLLIIISNCTFIYSQKEFNKNIIGYSFLWKQRNNHSLNRDKRIATKTYNNGWDCSVVGDTPLIKNYVNEWKIKIRNTKNNNGGGPAIGVGSDPDESITDGYLYKYWNFYCYNSSLYLKSTNQIKYHEGKVKTGDIVGLKVDTNLGELSFSVNGNDYGIACNNLPTDTPLYPIVDLYWSGDSVEIV